ncbi:ATP synthase F0 subunit B [bacterium]|nr:ATP synthase F0 subunit B [bacterium]
MEILLQLGANKTAFIQFALFIISISFLTVFVYGPFFKAYDKRLQQTKGADQVALETQEEAKKLESIFQTRAREINQKIQSVFDASKTQATESAGIILNTAKSKVTEQTESARKDIGAQKANAEKQVQQISQDVAAELSKKLTGAV